MMTTTTTTSEDEVDLDAPSEVSVRPWMIGGKQVPSSEIVYFSQILIVYIVIITCIINLSFSNGPHDLWIALMSSSLGYILPSPAISKRKSQVYKESAQ